MDNERSLSNKIGSLEELRDAGKLNEEEFQLLLKAAISTKSEVQTGAPSPHLETSKNSAPNLGNNKPVAQTPKNVNIFQPILVVVILVAIASFAWLGLVGFQGFYGLDNRDCGAAFQEIINKDVANRFYDPASQPSQEEIDNYSRSNPLADPKYSMTFGKTRENPCFDDALGRVKQLLLILSLCGFALLASFYIEKKLKEAAD